MLDECRDAKKRLVLTGPTPVEGLEQSILGQVKESIEVLSWVHHVAGEIVSCSIEIFEPC